jgi:hypothetical protein
MLKTLIIFGVILLAVALPTLAQTLSPGANVQAAVNAAVAPATITLGAGTFTGTAPLTLPTGITLTGSGALATHCVWTLPPATPWAIIIAANASNVTVTNLDISSNLGLLKMLDGSAYKSIHIVANNLSAGGGTYTGGLVYGINDTIPCSDLQLTHNYWHAIPGMAYAIFGMSGSNIDFNLYSGVAHGGQIQNPGANNSFSWNYGTGFTTKMQEGNISGAASLTVSNNVAYAWSTINSSSMGLSLLQNSAAPVTGWPVAFANNYIDLSLAGGGAGTTSGVGMEVGGGAVNCTGNLVRLANGPSAIMTDTPGSTGTSNQAFGTFIYGAYSSQGGPNGPGGWIGTIGTATTNLSAMPGDPANTFAGPAFYGTAPPPAPPTLTSITTVTSTSGAYSDGTSRQLSQSTATTKP